MVLVLVIIIAIALVWTIVENVISSNQRFRLQLDMAEAQSSMTNPLTFDAIRDIVQNVIVNVCIMEITNNGYDSKQEDALSVIIDDIILDISTKVELYLSKELIRQWEKFTTEEYRTRYIIFTAKVVFFNQLSKQRPDFLKKPKKEKDSKKNEQ